MRCKTDKKIPVTNQFSAQRGGTGSHKGRSEFSMVIAKLSKKREYSMIIRDIFLSCTKTYVVTPHLNRLNETLQMKGHNIWF